MSGLHVCCGAGKILADLLRFWPVAARRNSSFAPHGPRSRSCTKPRMRLRWAKSISTFFRNLIEIGYYLVLAISRAIWRASSCSSRVILRASAFGQHFIFHGQAWQVRFQRLIFGDAFAGRPTVRVRATSQPSIGAVCGKPLWVNIVPRFDPTQHATHRAKFCLPDRSGAFKIHNHAMVSIDQIVGGIAKECQSAGNTAPLSAPSRAPHRSARVAGPMRCSLHIGPAGFRLFAGLEAPTLVAGFDDVAVVGKTIE